MNQESEKAQDEPVLNADSFQRLLSAAYLLQEHNDGQRSLQPIGADRTSLFAVGAIVQKRTPSVRLVRPVEPTVPHLTTILLRRPVFWRTVETLAIAMIFCMMMGLSMHRLSALPSRTSLSSETPEQRDASQAARSTAKVLASPQQLVMTRNSRRSSAGGEGDSVAEDIVVRYQKRDGSLPGQAAKKATSGLVQGQPFPPKNTTPKSDVRLKFGRDADLLAADTVVQYGADVTMWSGNAKRAELDRLGR